MGNWHAVSCSQTGDAPPQKKSARAEIPTSDEEGTVPTERYEATLQTTFKWRNHFCIDYPNHTPCPPQTREREAIAVALRQSLLISPDDPLTVMREFV